MIVIDDTNTIGNNAPGLIPRDWSAHPYGSLPYTSPFSAGVLLIPESEWPARIAAMQGRWIRNGYTDLVPDVDQDGEPYCWAYSLTQAVEAERVRSGQPFVRLYPESLGGSVGYRSVGNYCGAAIAYAAKNGICDATFSPSQWNRSPSSWKTGWQEEAKNHKPVEFWELGEGGMWKEMVSALLCGYGLYIGLNWWRHAVFIDELVMQGSEICVSGPNSWGKGQRFILKGSKKIADEAYCVRSGVWSPS